MPLGEERLPCMARRLVLLSCPFCCHAPLENESESMSQHVCPAHAVIVCSQLNSHTGVSQSKCRLGNQHVVTCTCCSNSQSRDELFVKLIDQYAKAKPEGVAPGWMAACG